MIKTKRQPSIVLQSNLPAKREKPEDSSDSESEGDLLGRLFGGKEVLSTQTTLKDGESLEEENVTVTEQMEATSKKRDECVWHDDDDNKTAQSIAHQKFAEMSGGWLKVKATDPEEEHFGGKIFKRNNSVLPDKEIDLEECGTIGIRGAGNVSAFQFHPAAATAMVTQADILTMFQIDGRENPKLQSIRLDKFPIKSAQIISKKEVLCTSDFPWFYSYNLECGEIRRYQHIRGIRMPKIRGFCSSYNSEFLAFPDENGAINIVSGKTKEMVDVVQSAANCSVDCVFSRDGRKLWSLAESGEVMCFDLRQMRAVNSFNDMAGATSLGINGKETIFSVGSNSGLVNLYDAECQVAEEPKPFKTLKNLRAPVTTQKFNRNGELALFASELVAGQTKLYHTASESVIRNFPGSRKLDAVKLADFSPGSGFLGVGNKNVKLFKLNHYGRY